MLGRDGDDPLFLQAKEAQASVLEPFLGKSEFANHGQRVVEGQRLMQAASDIMLGWLHTTGLDGVERDFYIRQLWDAKGSALVESMEPTAMTEYAKLCGWTLAKAHARSGDAIAIGSLPRLRRGLRQRTRPLRGGATPTRTSATTPRSRRRSTRAASRRKQDCRPV